MTAEEWKRASEFMAKMEEFNINAIAYIFTFLAFPFILVYAAIQEVYPRLRGKIYDKSLHEWITKEEQQRRILREKYENRDLPIPPEGHSIEDDRWRFYFFEKRKLKIPYDQIVYVENEYNEKMHQFFEQNSDWLDTWQQWYGWDISHYDAEDIKEGMLYPQDYKLFRHGFLCNAGAHCVDSNADVSGTIHYYFDIDPDSDTPIKEQMSKMMSQIYQRTYYL